MILNVFNPDHDMALANGSPGYTPPKVIQRMAVDLAWLPRLWTDEGMTMADDFDPSTITAVRPWGWDTAIRQRLLRLGVPPEVMPDDEYLANVRRLSNRRLAVEALREFRESNIPNLCGVSKYSPTPALPSREGGLCIPMLGEGGLLSSVESEDNAPSPCGEGRGGVVLKAPWSSSGKGVMFVEGEMSEAQMAWCRNVMAQQGGVVIERMCDKRCDFAMEYEIIDGGDRIDIVDNIDLIDRIGEIDKIGGVEGIEKSIRFMGLSLFDNNAAGAYVGNVLTSLDNKMGMIGVDGDRLEAIRGLHIDFLRRHVAPYYSGPVGIDMLVTHDGLINPCIEINLRRTMGHVALAIERRQPCQSPRRFVVGYDKSSGYFARVEKITNFAL